MHPADRSAPAIEPAALDRLFRLGDATLRVALCAQLRDDFTRLRAAVGQPCTVTAARAAHEVKGLAATVGAFRLAEIAAVVDIRAEAMGDEARALVVAQLRTELDSVLAELARAAQGGAVA